MYVWKMTQALFWLCLAKHAALLICNKNSNFDTFPPAVLQSFACSSAWFQFLFMYCLDWLLTVSKKRFSRPLLRGRTWVYVGGSTHRVGLRSSTMTHPSTLSLSLRVQRLDGIQHTNTLDWIHDADWASGLKWNVPCWFVLRAPAPLCLLRTPTLKCLCLSPQITSLSVAVKTPKTGRFLLNVAA